MNENQIPNNNSNVNNNNIGNQGVPPIQSNPINTTPQNFANPIPNPINTTPQNFANPVPTPNETAPVSSVSNGNIPNPTINNITNVGMPTSVPPINDVKIESSNATTNIENSNIETASVSNASNDNKPPKNNKISTILLILLFIFLFAFVMGMPNIREFVQKLKSDTGLSEIEQEAKQEEDRQKQEQESKKPTSTPEEEKTTELTCTSSSQTIGNYTLVETQTFSYNNKNQILNSKIIAHYTFAVVDDNYTILKQQCDENSLKYLTHKGYTMACSYGDANIEISHEFDLKTFTPIVEGTTNIQANATYQQDINTIKETLIAQGYTCQ